MLYVFFWYRLLLGISMTYKDSSASSLHQYEGQQQWVAQLLSKLMLEKLCTGLIIRHSAK